MNKSEAIDIMRNLQAMIVSPNKQDKETVFAIQMGIDALKAQEPHVMTPEEVEKVEEQGVVWCEYKEGNHFPAIVEPFIRCGNIFENPGGYILLMEVTDCDDYLKYYRFWNAKPTDEQRKAVKWDD